VKGATILLNRVQVCVVSVKYTSIQGQVLATDVRKRQSSFSG